MSRLAILHVSDLHFGSESRFADHDPVDLADRLCRAALRQMKSRGTPPEIGLVVVSGDVTESALPKDYSTARQFFEAIAGHLGLDRRRFVFVPGNHDVSWLECKRVQLEFEEAQTGAADLRKALDNRKFRPFDEFVREFNGGVGREEFGTVLPGGAFVFDYTDLSLSVATLNSCEQESHRSEDHKGFIGPEQTQAVMNHWQVLGRPERLRIAVVHHNIASTVPENVRSWMSFLQREAAAGRLDAAHLERFATDAVGLEGRQHLHALVEDCCVQVVLHGHEHALGSRHPLQWQSRKGLTHVLSAGSWGLAPDKLPRDQPNAVQLVTLDTERPSLRSWTLVFEPRARPEGKVIPGTFVPDAAQPDGYTQDIVILPRIAMDAGAAVVTETAPPPAVVEPVRRKLPDERRAITHGFSIGGHEGTLTVGMYDDGTPGEIYITMAKEGSAVSGVFGGFGAAVTLALQYGVPLRVLCDKFAQTRFEPSGFTGNPDIPIAKSILDYIFRWLALKFVPATEQDPPRPPLL
jgi:hypothetical protein